MSKPETQPLLRTFNHYGSETSLSSYTSFTSYPSSHPSPRSRQFSPWALVAFAASSIAALILAPKTDGDTNQEGFFPLTQAWLGAVFFCMGTVVHQRLKNCERGISLGGLTQSLRSAVSVTVWAFAGCVMEAGKHRFDLAFQSILIVLTALAVALIKGRPAREGLELRTVSALIGILGLMVGLLRKGPANEAGAWMYPVMITLSIVLLHLTMPQASDHPISMALTSLVLLTVMVLLTNEVETIFSVSRSEPLHLLVLLAEGVIKAVQMASLVRMARAKAVLDVAISVVGVSMAQGLVLLAMNGIRQANPMDIALHSVILADCLAYGAIRQYSILRHSRKESASPQRKEMDA